MDSSEQFAKGCMWIIGILVGLLLLGESSAFSRDGLSIDPNKVAGLLDSCPSWTDSRSDRSKIVVAYKQISQASTDVIRAGIFLFVSRHEQDASYDIAMMGKLFVLNRYLFIMSTEEKSPSFLGGWEGLPMKNNTFDMEWPWTTNSEGALVLSGKYGGYSGHPFFAVEEFDYLRKQHLRRVQPL